MSATLGDIGAGNSLGRYELLIPVASGGMAVVWAARMKGTRGFQKIVAIKTMRPEMVEDPQFEQMFLDEAALASRIRHPHVVEILDLGEENDVLYIVMEWIDGEPLHVIMKEATSKGGIPLPISVRIAMQVCAGLHAAHELKDDSGKLVGLVHRDVSPQNVLVTWDGVAKVVDFGVAKAVGRGAGETVAGQVKGKVAWMAPEQARGSAIDRRSDIFAIGSLLYTMTTGRHPFRRDNELATMMNICSDERVFRPGKLVPGYPPQLEKALMQALEKDPAKRFPSANDMLKALDHALPSSMRVSTDDEVANFVHGLMSERFEKRREKIKEALRAADERETDPKRRIGQEATGTALMPLTEASSTGTVRATPIKEKSGSGPKAPPTVERWSVTDTTPSQSGTAAEASSAQPVVAPANVLLPPTLGLQLEQPAARSSSSRYIAIGGAVLGVAGIIALVAALRSGGDKSDANAATPPTSAPAKTAETAPATTSAAAVATTPPPASATAATSGEPVDTANVKASTHVPATTGTGKTGGKGTAAPTSPTATTGATAAKTAKPPSTALPQIRNPGF